MIPVHEVDEETAFAIAGIEHVAPTGAARTASRAAIHGM
jgi:hypothetical protein